MRQYHDIVAEWSKAPDLGSGLRWRRFKSCRCHRFIFVNMCDKSFSDFSVSVPTYSPMCENLAIWLCDDKAMRCWLKRATPTLQYMYTVQLIHIQSTVQYDSVLLSLFRQKQMICHTGTRKYKIPIFHLIIITSLLCSFLLSNAH